LLRRMAAQARMPRPFLFFIGHRYHDFPETCRAARQGAG